MTSRIKSIPEDRRPVARCTRARATKAELVSAVTSEYDEYTELAQLVRERLGESELEELPSGVRELFEARAAPESLGATYDRRTRRTIDLTRRAIRELERTGGAVSLRSIERASRAIDPGGAGISRRAILGNPAALTLYRGASAWPYRASVRKAPAPGDTPTTRLERRLGRLTQKELARALEALRDERRRLSRVLVRSSVATAKNEVEHLL